MIFKAEKLFSYIFLLIPLFLITGPAIPDIVITTSVIFSIFYFIFLKKYEEILKINFFIVSIVFWSSLLLISFFSYNKINSFQDSIIFIRFLLIPFSAYFIFFKSDKIFIRLLILILLLVVFVCIDTAFQFFNYSSEFGFGRDLIGFKSNWYGRLTGPFGNELIPGSYISKFGLIGYAYLILNKKFREKTLVHSIYLSLIFVVSYITGERMAFATYAMGLFFLFIFLDGYRKSIFLSILLGLLTLVIIMKFHPFYNDFEVVESTEFHQGLKIEKFYKCKNETEEMCSTIIEVQPSFIEIITKFNTSAYGEIYLLAYKMFIDNPITGIGLNNFKFICETNDFYKKLMVNYDCASHPHNIYIQWLSEGGITVFLIFILYLLFLINFIIKNKGEKNYKIISLIVILIMFWPIMSTGSLVKNWYGVITFFIIGILMRLSKFRNID